MNQIKDRYTGDVLYEYESGLTIRQALEQENLKRIKLGGVSLCYANLGGADLSNAKLVGADLRFANLRDANLEYATLYGANLCGSNLCGANLNGATLYGANLYGADLRGAYFGKHGKLIGKRPFFQCGPIGSDSDYLMSFLTEKGVLIKIENFTGTLDEFRTKVESTHSDNDHAKEYQMAILMVEAHASLWTPEET